MGNNIAIAEKFTSADLASMPDDGKLYEIIDGELYVSRQPDYEHQYTCARLEQSLNNWSDETHAGAAVQAPGLIFGEHDDVAPDVVWMSFERLASGLDEAGHLIVAPELVIEVLSPGKANEDRDRKAKLNLYSRRGVDEYWVVSWLKRFVEVYRRKGGVLKLAATLHNGDTLESPLLPRYSCEISKLFLLESPFKKLGIPYPIRVKS
jgi:Uma2 family endonuclease